MSTAPKNPHGWYGDEDYEGGEEEGGSHNDFEGGTWVRAGADIHNINPGNVGIGTDTPLYKYRPWFRPSSFPIVGCLYLSSLYQRAMVPFYHSRRNTTIRDTLTTFSVG